jgi:hypothetical protein
VEPVHGSTHAQAAAADTQHLLLEQLQVGCLDCFSSCLRTVVDEAFNQPFGCLQGFCDQAHKLLALISVQRAQVGTRIDAGMTAITRHGAEYSSETPTVGVSAASLLEFGDA